MNCPHGRQRGQACDDATCTQRRFEPNGGGPVVVVSLLYCETCDEQLGAMPKTLGLSARWIHEFMDRHARCGIGWADAIGWEAIEVDTGRDLEGAGVVLLRVDSDAKNVIPMNWPT